MGIKRKWCSILLVGLVLILATSIMACAPAPRGSSGCEPPPGISWDEVTYHIGERATVCGPVVDTYWASGSNGKPTFLNIGKPYSSSNRFTVVIWIDNRGNFPPLPEDHYLGRNICVTGLIESYNGIPQIEATDSSQIQEQ